jgi:hypothetical protein
MQLDKESIYGSIPIDSRIEEDYTIIKEDNKVFYLIPKRNSTDDLLNFFLTSSSVESVESDKIKNNKFGGK